MGFLSGVGDALERMRRMMVKTDVDLSQLPGEEIAQTMREAGKACCGCGATGECDKFLDETPDHVKAGVLPERDALRAFRGSQRGVIRDLPCHPIA